MKLTVPTCDDRPVWDVWLSMLWLPSVTVADELQIFESLAGQSATAQELAQRLGLNLRGTEILCPMLVSLGFLMVHEGRFSLSDAGRNFMLRGSPFYWGGVFPQVREKHYIHVGLKRVMQHQASGVTQSADKAPVDAWESGQLDIERARTIAFFMHGHSMPAATGAALHGPFAGISRLLDVGGGSGCFSITLAQQHPDLRCTVMDLPAMNQVAREYICAAGVQDRVDTRDVDMFRHEWPRGYDALFFSNIFHDWSVETNAQLAAKAFETLPGGGQIFLHEVLLDDSGAAPRTATAFSVLMLLGTRGRQFTFAQLRDLLAGAGFLDITVTSTYGYYSVVRGRKP